MNTSQQSVKEWYSTNYKKLGISSQRLYPNEELCRFIGRTYNHHKLATKQQHKILEVGCGSAGNLFMLTEQGFDCTGLDISSEAIHLSKCHMESRRLQAKFIEASMTSIPTPDNSYDLVVDVFSSNCLTLLEFKKYLHELTRVLTDSGKVFFYTPSKRSDAYLNSSPSSFIDSSTLSGIQRKNSPFYGNTYPFRFEHLSEFKSKLEDAGLTATYAETTSRTYHNLSEYFEFITVVAELSKKT